ncbi:hypothetical protein CsSME_00039107 [Camellia sinensis var. sinensis]
MTFFNFHFLVAVKSNSFFHCHMFASLKLAVHEFVFWDELLFLHLLKFLPTKCLILCSIEKFIRNNWNMLTKCLIIAHQVVVTLFPFCKTKLEHAHVLSWTTNATDILKCWIAPLTLV